MKYLLKVIVCLTVLLMSNPFLFAQAQENDLLKGNFDSKVLENQSVDFYAVDITPPQLDISSIKVSKSQLKPGDKVTISMKITDDLSGIDRVQLNYKAPLSGKSEGVWMTYNASTKSYEWTKFITDETESGTWKIDFLCMTDNRDNNDCIHNVELGSYNGVDLSKGNFTVSGTGANVDITPPQLDLSSIKVSKSQLKPGDKVTISMKITDNLSGIDRVQLNYKAPLSGKSEGVWMTYNASTKSYEWTKFITDETEFGIWKIDFLCMTDNRDNNDCIHNVELGSYNGVDLSKGNFTVNATGKFGWIKENNTWYYYDISGKMHTGWLQEGNTWYYLKSNGAMATGWEKVNGTWYYFNQSGKMATGWLQEGNTWYYLKSNGAMATGWEKVNGTWYYFNQSGKMAKGWLQEGNTWYYLKSNGAMATSWEKVNGTWYYFNQSGKMATGWLQEGSTWYYLKSSGAMVTGWEKIGHDWYYFYSSGKMATNTVIGGWKITSSGKAYKL